MNSDNLEFKIRQVLSELMEKQSISEAELARRTRVPPATINRLMAGATPDPRLSTMRPLAHYFEVSIDQLIGDEALTALRLTEKFSILPIIPWEEVPRSEDFIASLNFDNWQEWETTSAKVSQSAFSLVVKQHTLGIPFTFGTLLIVEPNTTPKDGDYVIVHHLQNESTSLKRLVIDGKDKWLNAPNENIQSILMNEDYRICGIIVRVCIPFNKD